MSSNKQLKRTLTLFPSTMIVITSIIGSGIFTVPGTVMAAAQGSGPNLLAWIIAGVSCLLMALVYVELAPAMPAAGGPYVYLRNAYGEKTSFLYGWAVMIDHVSILALLSLAFTNYLNFFFSFSPLQCKIIAIAILTISAFINIRGVKFGAIITNGFTIAKLLALGLVILGGLFALDMINFQPVVSASAGWSTTLTAAVPAIFAFGGYNQLAYMSEEVKDPNKNIPRALLIGMVVVILFNMLLSVVCMGTISVDGLATTDKAIAVAAQNIFGNTGAVIVGIGALISIYGTISGAFMSMPRVAFTMGRDGVFPKSFGKIHPKYETPYVSICVYSAFAIILVLSGSFYTLLMMGTFIGRLLEVLVATSLVVLRKKHPEMERPLKMWGYPATIVVVILLTTTLALLVPLKEMFYGLVLASTSIPAYILFSYLRKKSNNTPQMPISK